MFIGEYKTKIEEQFKADENALEQAHDFHLAKERRCEGRWPLPSLMNSFCPLDDSYEYDLIAQFTTAFAPIFITTHFPYGATIQAAEPGYCPSWSYGKGLQRTPVKGKSLKVKAEQCTQQVEKKIIALSDAIFGLIPKSLNFKTYIARVQKTLKRGEAACGE